MKIKFLLSFMVGFMLGFLTLAIADEIDKKYIQVNSFSDERELAVLNKDLQRLGEFGIIVTSNNVTVPAGVSRTTVTLVSPLFAPITYAVFVMPSWSANAHVLQKTTTGFIIEYTNPSSSSLLDWIVVR